MSDNTTQDRTEEATPKRREDTRKKGQTPRSKELNTFTSLLAAGFAMLESGLVRAKNTTEILTKNIALYAVACIMYLATGYALMYSGGWFLQGIEAFDLTQVLADSAENGFDGTSVY